MNSGKLDEAEEIIEAAYSILPKNPFIIDKKGLILLSKKNPKEALKYFTKALKLLFREEFLANIAKAQMGLRHWDQALETSERLLKYNPESSEAWKIKGKALKNLHQQMKANICFQNAEKFKEKPISLLEDEGKNE